MDSFKKVTARQKESSMNQEQIISTLEALANGIDPTTGEILPATSPYNQPEVIRALFHAVKLIPKPKKVKKTVEQKQRENLDKGLPKNYGLPWQEADINSVIQDYQANMHIRNIAEKQCRKPNSIIGLLKKHEIISEQQAMMLSAELV